MRGCKTIDGLARVLFVAVVSFCALPAVAAEPLSKPAEKLAAKPAAKASGPATPARIGLRIFPVGSPDDAAGDAAKDADGVSVVSSLRHLREAFAKIEGPGFVLQALGPDPGAREPLPAAADLEDRARSLELALEFREAAGAWKALLEQMLSRPLLLTEPQRVAKVQLALAAARAEAGERELALLGFRTALALDLNARLGPAYPPRARELFGKARAEGSLLPSVPRPQLQREVARARGLDAIVWVALGHDRGGEVLLRGFTRTDADADLPDVRRALPAQGSAHQRLIQQEARSLERLLRESFPGPAPIVPWYRRGWVLATAGAFLAVAATTAVLVRVLSPARIDVVVQH